VGNGSGFDVHGEGYLRVVDNIKRQKAFMVVLEEFVRLSWEQFTARPTGIVPYAGFPEEPNLGLLQARLRYAPNRKLEICNHRLHEWMKLFPKR
jgi:hypothetical protein